MKSYIAYLIAYALPVAILCYVIAAVVGDTHKDDVVAVIDHRPVRLSTFITYLKKTQSLPDSGRDLTNPPDEAALQHAFDDFLFTQALELKAKRLGVFEDERFIHASELIDIKLLSQMATEKHRDTFAKQSTVTDKEVRAYYEAHKWDYTTAPHFTAYQLLVYVKGNPAFPNKGASDAVAHRRALEALAELKKGKSWLEVAPKYSDEIRRNQPDGLIRNGAFGRYAPELEQAIRTQPIGLAGDVVKSAFGYHVVEVLERTLQPTPKPFAQLQDILKQKLSDDRAQTVGQQFMAPIREAARLVRTEAGNRNGALLDNTIVAPNEVLAQIDGHPVTESEFQWFLKDAFPASQRTYVFSAMDSRQRLLQSYLDMQVLARLARAQGLHRTATFAQRKQEMQHQLLGDFVSSKDESMPGPSCTGGSNTDEDAQQAYRAQLFQEVDMQVSGLPQPFIQRPSDFL